MNWDTTRFDWNHARAFLVTAQEGSLTAAAQSLGLTQPTLGRQVTALEEELGVTLFERVGRGLELTESGRDLLDHVRLMGEAATRLSLSASGHSESVEGSITITATDATAVHVLPSILTRIRLEQPSIDIRIVATNSLSDLRRREADIAIRGARPTDPDLFARKIADSQAELYGSHTYLDRLGSPSQPSDLEGAMFIGFDENESFIEALKALGLPMDKVRFPIIANNHIAYWELVRQGLGIGVAPTQLGAADPLVRLAAPWLEPFRYPVWLVTHRELHTSKRIRLVFDLLAEELIAFERRRP